MDILEIPRVQRVMETITTGKSPVCLYAAVLSCKWPDRGLVRSPKEHILMHISFECMYINVAISDTPQE